MGKSKSHPYLIILSTERLTERLEFCSKLAKTAMATSAILMFSCKLIVQLISLKSMPASIIRVSSSLTMLPVTRNELQMLSQLVICPKARMPLGLMAVTASRCAPLDFHMVRFNPFTSPMTIPTLHCVAALRGWSESSVSGDSGRQEAYFVNVLVSSVQQAKLTTAAVIYSSVSQTLSARSQHSRNWSSDVAIFVTSIRSITVNATPLSNTGVLGNIDIGVGGGLLMRKRWRSRL
jgi:hypothetical protein